MLGATIGDLIAHKAATLAQIHVTEAQTIVERKATNAERAREMERMRIEARKEKQRQKLFTLRRQILDERTTIAYQLTLCQTVRGDGRNVARPGMKVERDELRSDLARVNTRIDLVNKQLGIGQPSANPRAVTRRARNARDAAIVAMCTRRMNKSERAAMSAHAQELAVQCRPANGYPAPPFRRADEYPQGAMMKAPKGGLSIKHVRAEHDRLSTCIETLIEIEGETPRTVRMFNHVERLDRMIESMCRNPHIRKRPGTKEYMLRDAA